MLPKSLSAAPVLLLLVALNSSFSGTFISYAQLKAQKLPGVGLIDHEYAPAWRWLKQNGGTDSVVLAGEQVMPLIPARTGLRVWTDSHLAVELTPVEEALSRNQLLWALEGLSPEELRVKLTPPDPMPVAQWTAGLNAELLADIVRLGKPPIDRERGSWMALGISREYARLGTEGILRNASGYRLDYLVRGPHESTWGNRPEAWLELRKVGEFGSVRIDQVLGFKR
jgi:hypothetical protein